MAWTEKLPSGKYVGKFRDGLGKRRTAEGGPFSHKQGAKRAADLQEAAARRRGWEVDNKTTWAQWVAQWEPSRTVEPSTRQTDRERLNRHITPYWGKARLSAISPHDVQEWVAALLAGTAKSADQPLKPATVKRLMTVFSAALADATRAGLIDLNPASRARVGGGQETHERFLTKSEVAAVADLLTRDRAIPFRALAYTGLRWGELVGLDHAQVDRDRGVLRVTQTWDRATGDIKPYPKSRKPRTVPIPDHVLKEWPTGRHDSPVFLSPRGLRLRAKSFRLAVEDAAKDANVTPFRLHDLRHTTASWLIQAGVPLAEVGRLLGHTSTQTTARYAHLAEQPTDLIKSALS